MKIIIIYTHPYYSVKSSDSEKFVYSVGATGFGVLLIYNYLEKKYPWTKTVQESPKQEEEESDKNTNPPSETNLATDENI